MKKMLTRLALLLTAILVGATLAPAAANATLPDAPARVCPGTTPNDPWARAAMFCSAEKIAKPGYPYFVNTVAVVNGEQQFCVRRVDGAKVTPECHPYWPFLNPTVNAYRAPASAFTSSRLVGSDKEVRMLWRTIDRQDRRIQKLRHKLHQAHR